RGNAKHQTRCRTDVVELRSGLRGDEFAVDEHSRLGVRGAAPADLDTWRGLLLRDVAHFSSPASRTAVVNGKPYSITIQQRGQRYRGTTASDCRSSPASSRGAAPVGATCTGTPVSQDIPARASTSRGSLDIS